ncbi:MAG: transcription antitermination factor NusB [Candidatus Aminicenantes bacterium]|nr:transcription antitermination factor NusB [Candidatus Aminicenantes bacterium]
MGKKRQARESALQILFQLEFDETQVDTIIPQYWEDRKASQEVMESSAGLVKGVVSHLEAIDSIIQGVSENWRLSRMALIDRNILRIATYELFFGEDLAPAIIMNEAIEIAKKYSGDQSATFINGILDAMNKKTDALNTTLKVEGND